MNINLNELKEEPVVAVFSLLFITASGVLSIFLFDKNLFLELDFFKLIFLSIGIVLPFIVLNLFLYLILSEQDDNIGIGIFAGCILSIIPIYFPILAYAFWEISVVGALIVSIAIEVIYIILAVIVSKVEKMSGTK